MGKIGTKESPRPGNASKLRRSSSNIKLMPWELRHQHTITNFLGSSHSAQRSSEVAVKNKTPSNTLKDITVDGRMPANRENVDECMFFVIGKCTKENTGSPQKSHTNNDISVRLQELSPFRVPIQTYSKVLEKPFVHKKEAVPRESQFESSQNITSKTKMKVTEAKPPKVNVPDVSDSSSRGTKFKNGQLYTGNPLYGCNRRRMKMQLSKQPNATLNKPLKYAKKYNLDEIFNYVFPCVKEPMHKRLM